MTHHHNSFSKNYLSLKNEMPSWIFSMMRSLPELLVFMLDRKNPQSLERLQLLSIDIALYEPSQNSDGKFLYPKLQHSKDSPDFLILSGDLIDDKKVLTLTITYFLRSTQKFFRISLEENSPTTRQIFPDIKHADINQFLCEMGQFNSLFVDEQIIGLYGRSVFIPSHMMLWLMLRSIFSISPSALYKNFHARFFRAALPGTLTLSYRENPDSFFGAFSDEKGILMTTNGRLQDFLSASAFNADPALNHSI